MKAQTLGDPSSMEFMKGRRIFEINPDHPIVKDLNVRLEIRSNEINAMVVSLITNWENYFFRLHARMILTVQKPSGLWSCCMKPRWSLVDTLYVHFEPLLAFLMI